MGLTIKGGQEPNRNDPCPCESGLKYKYCHGDPCKKAVCERVVLETMARLIHQEQIKKGLRCKHGILKTEHCQSCKVEGDDNVEKEILCGG